MTRYLYVEATTKQPAALLAEEFREAKNRWICPGRFHIKPNIGSIDINVPLVRLGPTALNFVFGTGLGLARKAFFEEVGWDLINRNLYLGRLYLRGVESKSWVTFHGRQPINVRGLVRPGVRKCEHCGSEIYFSYEPSYIWPPPNPSFEVFDKGGTGLVIRSDIAAKLDLKHWKGIRLYNLKVEEPPDTVQL